MRFPKALLFSIPVAVLALSDARDASACGGCFHETPIQQSENTQVTGHRMIVSISKTQTTLYDQIMYMGSPSSFAWVLPIKGMVDVGLSSDALFANLDVATQVTVASPVIQCPGPPFCGGAGFSSTGVAGGFSAGASSSTGGSVVVTAQQVVGPYETVQLHSSDPNALKTWLAMHSYVLTADVSPIIDAYVAEGFDFLALKLVPGMSVTAMRPVRVTTPGGSPVLPLRMVAAGTGATTSITLWVMSEGRYEPSNFSSFQITADKLVWDWDTMSSNYSKLKQAGYDGAMGKSWLLEAGEPFSMYSIQGALDQLAMYDPTNSGYGDAMGVGAPMEEAADLAALWGTLDPTSLWVTRLHGELPRAALATDLQLGASGSQTQVARYLQATNTVGTAPSCPNYPPCEGSTGGPSGGTGGTGGTGGAGGGWDFWGNNSGGGGSSSGGGCAVTPARSGLSELLGALGVTFALALARRRRPR